MSVDAPVSFRGLVLSGPGGGYLGSTTAARPCGTCPDCGGQLYEGLTHGCTTSVRPGTFRVAVAEEQPTSVGLVCVCGEAVATLPGTTASCGCGRVWVVSALRIAGP